jgi:hypothetical protein
MSQYSGESVWNLFEKNLAQAKKNLSNVSVFCGREPSFSGLSGWVYEQTVQYCIRRELKAFGIKADIQEQLSLVGRAKADLAVNRVAIEIKSRGLFGMTNGDFQRHRKYQKAAKAKGYNYVFVTSGEGSQIYRRGIIRALGHKNVFFLDKAGDWSRLIHLLVLRKKSDQT